MSPLSSQLCVSGLFGELRGGGQWGRRRRRDDACEICRSADSVSVVLWSWREREREGEGVCFCKSVCVCVCV